jgi:hypothetical protein
VTHPKLRLGLVTVLVVCAVGSCLTSCQSFECGRGEPTAEEALTELIKASADADDTSDVCRFVTPGYVYDLDDVQALAETFGEDGSQDVRIEVTDQLGSIVLLTASSSSGSVSEKFQALDAEGKRATINFGRSPAE